MVDFNALGAQAAKGEAYLAPFCKGRVLQADADFFAYEYAFLDESVNENFKRLRKHLEVKRQMAGAEFINVHLTMGLKGGREQMATVKGYQEHRTDPARDPIKVRVRELRSLLANLRTETIFPVVNMTQEADDSLTQCQEIARKEYGNESSVIMSSDKDLWMVNGLHCDPKTGMMYNVDGYGGCSYKDVGNVELKLIGRGTSWFWHQMIMGDGADNIPGLPKLTGRLANLYLPNKKYDPHRKAIACGEAKAVAMLQDVRNDALACFRVLEAYIDYYGVEGKERFFEQAFLLWMRRTENPLDVLDFLTPLGFSYELTQVQLQALKRFEELCEFQATRTEL